MNCANGIGLCECEEVVVALHVARPVGEPRAAEVGLSEAMALEFRAIRAVEHHDTLPERGLEEREAIGADESLAHVVGRSPRMWQRA